MRIFLSMVVTVFTISGIGSAQRGFSLSTAYAYAYSEPSDRQKNDPAYKMYKEGYRLVLDEKWEEARQKFAGMTKKYPKSDYLDDAEYWSAIAIKHVDKKKAVDEYERFILKYPNSNYFDDAFADYQGLSTVRPLSFGMSSDEDGTRMYIAKGASGIELDSDGVIIRDRSDSV